MHVRFFDKNKIVMILCCTLIRRLNENTDNILTVTKEVWAKSVDPDQTDPKEPPNRSTTYFEKRN